MRNFILAGNCAYASSLNSMNNGQIAFTYLNNGVQTIMTTGNEPDLLFNLVLARNTPSGDVILPMSKKHLSYVKGVYSAATTFVGTIEVADTQPFADYTVIIVVKGKKFNERNRWTATIHTGASPVDANVATALARAINNNTVSHDIVATVSGTTITLTAQTAGVDYAIVLADAAHEFTQTVTTSGIPAYGDAEYVKDLANKAAADAGFDDTATDGLASWPGIIYPLDPLAGDPTQDAGFTIYTIRFTEPRLMAQARNDEVHQIVQIAFPTGAEAIATVDTILAALVDKYE